MCDDGFFGTECEFKSCQNNCSSNGVCNYTSGVCQCFEGFGGVDCSNMTCKDSCSLKGICLNGKCYCQEDYTGYYCEKSKFL